MSVPDCCGATVPSIHELALLAFVGQAFFRAIQPIVKLPCSELLLARRASAEPDELAGPRRLEILTVLDVIVHSLHEDFDLPFFPLRNLVATACPCMRCLRLNFYIFLDDLIEAPSDIL